MLMISHVAMPYMNKYILSTFIIGFLKAARLTLPAPAHILTPHNSGPRHRNQNNPFYGDLAWKRYVY